MSAVAALLAAAAASCWWPSPWLARSRLPAERRRPRRLGRPAAWPRRRHAGPRARDVAALSKALATELRAGQSPSRAWLAVMGGWRGSLPGGWVPGTDVPALLRRWSQEDGWGGLSAVAICWQLADETGAGLADALDRVAESMRHEHEIASEVSSQLSGVRATASVLASLPFVSLAVGTLLGAEPLRMLLTTAVGRVCLALGAGLAAVGWWWLTRQATAVRRSLRW